MPEYIVIGSLLFCVLRLSEVHIFLPHANNNAEICWIVYSGEERQYRIFYARADYEAFPDAWYAQRRKSGGAEDFQSHDSTTGQPLVVDGGLFTRLLRELCG